MATPALTPSAAAPLPEPLRLPRGSVRGLLAIVLVLTFGFLLTRDSSTPPVLVNAVVVCLAFYFGTHASTAPAPAVPGGAGVHNQRPRIVRALIFVGFAGLAGWFLRSGVSLDKLPPELIEIWEVLGGYVLGLTLSWAIHRRAHETNARRRLALVFRDLSAVGALGFTLFACYALATGIVSTFGQTVEQGLSLIITYYFGSRVIPR